MKKQKSVLHKPLSNEIKVWWILNLATVIQLLLVPRTIMGLSLFGSYDLNNPFLHTLYNITSVFLIIPFYLLTAFFHIVFALKGDPFQLYTDVTTSLMIIICTFFLSLGTNLVIAKLVTRPLVTDLYKKTIGRNKLVLLIVIVLVVFVFYIG